MSRGRVQAIPIIGGQTAVRGRRPNMVTSSGLPSISYNLVYDYMNNEGNNADLNPFIRPTLPFRPQYERIPNNEQYNNLRLRIIELEREVDQIYRSMYADKGNLLVRYARTGGGFGPVPNPEYFVEVDRINTFLRRRREAIAELRPLVVEMARLHDEATRVELEIFEVLRDPVVLSLLYRFMVGLQPGDTPLRRIINNRAIKQNLRIATAYTVDEEGRDFLDISPNSTMNWSLRSTLERNPDAYRTNLIIVRNLIAIPNLQLENVLLQPRTRVTMYFDNIAGGYRTEDIIIGRDARNQLYDNIGELRQIGIDRLNRIIGDATNATRPIYEAVLTELDEPVPARNLENMIPEDRERYLATFEAERIAARNRINVGELPAIIAEGFISNENTTKIMLSVYHQLMNMRTPLIAELYTIKGESTQREETHETYIVSRPNTYLPEREEVRLYGFWPYVMPENNFNFNTTDDCYCVVTSITKNPLFPELETNIEEEVADIYFRAGIELYDSGLIDNIYKIHDQMSKSYNYPFVAEYYEYVKHGKKANGEQKMTWKAHRKSYPGGVNIKKADITEDMRVFKVVISRKRGKCDHVFNVNNDAAFTFLTNYINGALYYREGFGDLEYRGKSEVYWSDAIVRILIKKIQKDPANLFKQFEVGPDGAILNFQEEEISDPCDPMDYVKIEDIEDEEEQENALLTASNYLYSCLDFEASYKKPYSMSYNYFNAEGHFQREADRRNRNITADSVKEKIEPNDVKIFLDDCVRMCNSMSTTRAFILMHNGGRYDWPVILEELIMDVKQVSIVDPLSAGGCLISATVKYRGCTLEIRDSCRMTGTSLDGLVKLLGLKTPKTKFMYCLYNEEMAKPAAERKLNWSIDELEAKKETVDANYKEEIENFIKEYGRKESYDLVSICVEYCNNDVEILRLCMIKYMELQHTTDTPDSMANTFKGLNKEYVRVRDPEAEELEYIGNIRPIENMSLTNHTKKIAKSEGCFKNSYTQSSAFHDYSRPFVVGGRVWMPRSRKFVSNQINAIMENKYFYIDRDTEEGEKLAVYYAGRYNYNPLKEKLFYDPANEPQEVVELRQRMRRYGACMIDLDAVSLYPSAIYNIKYFPTGRAYVLTPEVFNNTSLERKILPNEPIWYAYVNIIRTANDMVLTCIDGEYDEFPLFTKKVNGKTVPIGLVERNYPMNLIDYKEMRHYYPNATIELVHGYMYTGKTEAFSEFTKKLYCKRAYYKALKKAKDPRGATEAIIKLMLNSMYGDMIRKKVLIETKYASIHKYSLTKGKIMKSLEKYMGNNISDIIYNGKQLAFNERRTPINAEIVRIFNELNTTGKYRGLVRHTSTKIRSIIAKDIVDRLPFEFKLNDVEMLKREQTGVTTYGLVIESANITHKLTYTKNVKHATKPHWGALILSGSKAIMNKNCSAVNWQINYTDTDSLHVDGSHVLRDEVKATLDPEDKAHPELSMTKMHSDFAAWEPVKDNEDFFVTPLDKEIGLCSIDTNLVNLKFYRDMVMGVSNEKIGVRIVEDKEVPILRSYITIHKHCRCKGMNADQFREEEWDKVLEEPETKLKRDLLDTKAMSIQKNNKTGEVVVKSKYLGDTMSRAVGARPRVQAQPIPLTLNIKKTI